MSTTIAAVVTKMVTELAQLKSDEERDRAFAAARAVFGMAGPGPAAPTGEGRDDASARTKTDGQVAGVSAPGATWIKKHGLASDKVEEHFHVDAGKVTLIGDPIGNGKREQSINTYLLTGVAALLETGTADFTDQTARDYCHAFGCYDPGNHAATLTHFGNRITGSKKTGWKLTAPGLSAAGALIKSQAQSG